MPSGLSDVGLSLMIIGASLVIVGYIEPGLMPLMILGVSSFIVGLLVQWNEGALEQTIVNLSMAAWENVSALIEAAGVINSGVYLPSGMTGGEPMVLVPSTPVTKISDLKVIGKPLATYGQGFRGLLLASPGSRAVLACRDSLTSDVEVSLRNCLIRQLSLASGVAVASNGDVTVRIDGVRSINLYGDSAVKAVLGSTIASIVASIVAEATGRPVTIQGEEGKGNALIIRLRVLGNA